MDKPIKVLALSYLFPNAVMPNHGIFVFNRLNALSRYADIKVINPIPWSPVHRYSDNYRHNRNIPLKTVRGNLEIFHPRFLSIPKFFKGVEVRTYQNAVAGILASELKDFKFDLIDLHWTFPDLPAGYALSQQYAKPFLATLRGMEAFHIQDGGVRARMVKKLLPKANRIISLSDELRQQSIAVGSSPEKNTVIRNGVDDESFNYIEQDEARNHLGLEKDGAFIVMVGALIRRKGFDLLIDALADLKKTVPNLKLRIIGSEGHEGDFRNDLHARIAKYGLQDSVVFHGAVENQTLKYWYNAADVFCLASRGEGSPNVLTEALACGCPAVASDVGSVKEIMASEHNLGYVFASENVTELRDSLQKLIVQSSSSTDRQQRSQSFGKYNWDWCAAEVNDQYQYVLSANSN